LSWSQTGERKIFGPDLVVETEEKVKVIQENLKAAQSRQKSYFDKSVQGFHQPRVSNGLE
jgi:glutamine amidotransferase-like uncharacterized protein